jgi:hypothetical protein
MNGPEHVRRALDRSARRQGLDLGAQICKGFVAGSNGTNHTLHRTFRAFSGHLFFAEKFFVLASILKSADTTCASRNDHPVAMGMHVMCKLKTNWKNEFGKLGLVGPRKQHHRWFSLGFSYLFPPRSSSRLYLTRLAYGISGPIHKCQNNLKCS